ncbi:recombinase family protein [Dysgonomonas sp. HGC4]|uniref:recombinase family protein n=1 Tax=Dysgonomonas sp. HGC4 TaxID=1658009 RepID=UPI00358F4248
MQVNLLKDKCDKIYTDISNGVRQDRKSLQDMLDFLRTGDTVIVYKIDRISKPCKSN